MKRRDPAEPQLVNVRHSARAAEVLWRLLEERPAVANISHKAMPSREEHESFVEHHPYRAWYLIKHDGEFVGAAYLTRHFEIGIAILAEHQHKGFGKWAVRELVTKWEKAIKGKPSVQRKAFLANIAPANEASAKFFEGLGFRHVMNVYALDLD